jgi:hypothetical protein
VAINIPTTPVGSGSLMPVVTCPTCGRSAHANPCKGGVRTTCCGTVVEISKPARVSEATYLGHEPAATKKSRRQLREDKSQGRRHS